MPACSARGCKERKYHNGITFHRFPSDPVLRQNWITAIRREYFVPSKSAVLCSKHFREEDIDRTSLLVVRLREGAVPSIFDACPSHLRPAKKTRKPPKSRSSNIPPIPNPDNKIHLPIPKPATTETDLLNNPDTAGKQALKRKLQHAQSQLSLLRKKIKILLQAKRQLQKKAAHLSAVISDLNNSITRHSLIDPNESVIPDHDYTYVPRPVHVFRKNCCCIYR
ncbi:THAP domain-containing protein 2 [Microcaecilia unicolor]|uniref:THAP domain-containing protein 2-like n=1 Tax=Microcaecilia unicolor TaxID=1415580 RepID=A0A6P8A1J9_9AMPH|nr:THAP domain-containing protein 2-like [Microcaecilia unicolor]